MPAFAAASYYCHDYAAIDDFSFFFATMPLLLPCYDYVYLIRLLSPLYSRRFHAAITLLPFSAFSMLMLLRYAIYAMPRHADATP